MTTETAAKKDVQKLQRAIIDGLEDVKAQDIQVFNTEHLSPLFERVIVASGTSNRQTKALAASVRDAVREAGFGKPRIEGEENGEWIIVDCGAAVAHIMQPVIRQYYHLEELWGDMPIRLKLGAPKPMAKASEPEPEAKPGKNGKGGAKSGKPAARSAGGKAPAKTAGKTSARPSARPAGKAAAGKPAPAKSATSKPAVKVVGKPAPKPAAKTTAKPAVKSAAKPAAKPAAKKAAAKPAAAKKAPARKA